MSKLAAAVVGLGQAGSRFDEEARPAIWSHAGAFLALADRYRLAAGADIDRNNRSRFADRCPACRVYADAHEMMMTVKPEVVSVCTPPAGRAELVEDLLAAHRPRVLVCEKPLAVDAQSRKRIVDACRRAGVPLIVNYNRRYAQVYRSVREVIAAEEVGPLTAVTISAGNRLWSVGSHAVDLLLYLSGGKPESWRILPLPALDEGSEPAADVVCRLGSGIAGRVLTVGFRDMLVFEAEVVGRKGRIRVSGNGARATFSLFMPSPEYAGYRVLDPERVLYEADTHESTFVTLLREAADVAEGRTVPSSSGDDALASEGFLDVIAAECVIHKKVQ